MFLFECIHPDVSDYLLQWDKTQQCIFSIMFIPDWIIYTCAGKFSCTSSLIIDKGLQQELSVTCDCRDTKTGSI